MINAQGEYARPKFRAVLEQPVLDRLRQQRRHAEVPKEHPNKQGNVAKKLDVAVGKPAQDFSRCGAQGAAENSQRDGEQPAQAKNLQGGEKPLEQTMTGLAAP